MSALQWIPHPNDRARVESGPVQFGDDWPGTFIRGDHAAYYALHLRRFLAGHSLGPIELSSLRGLLSELEGSNVAIVGSGPVESEVTP